MDPKRGIVYNTIMTSANSVSSVMNRAYMKRKSIIDHGNVIQCMILISLQSPKPAMPAILS